MLSVINICKKNYKLIRHSQNKSYKRPLENVPIESVLTLSGNKVLVLAKSKSNQLLSVSENIQISNSAIPVPKSNIKEMQEKILLIFNLI